VEGEPPCPSREAALAAVIAEVGEDGDECVVGSLDREVLNRLMAELRKEAPALGERKARSAKQQCVEFLDRIVAAGPAVPEPLEPFTRSDVGSDRRAGGATRGSLLADLSWLDGDASDVEKPKPLSRKPLAPRSPPSPRGEVKAGCWVGSDPGQVRTQSPPGTHGCDALVFARNDLART
jgi:hypothetical protein